MTIFKFKESTRSYNTCIGCYGEIKNIDEEIYDGEDYWHKDCKKKFDDKMFGLINKPPRVFTLRRLENERG